MRIALFSWESVHSVLVGGVAVHVSNLGRSLAADGHEVHIFTQPGVDQEPDDRIDGVEYHRCPFRRSTDFVAEMDNMCGAFIDRFREVQGRRGRFDVLHAHDWLTAKSLAWTRDESGHKHVFTMHSTEFGRCGNAHCDGRSRAVRDREWEGTYCSDRVIAVSRHLKDEVRQIYRVPEDKMRVVYNGVDVRRFDVPVDVGAVKERYGLGRMDPTVLFCGRLVWQKGPDLLLEAVPPLLGYYPHAKFLYVGDGEMRGQLETRARELNVSHALRFLGMRTGRELIEVFRSSDAVCVPSRNEPFGIVILEAWSAGKPVVATRNGGPSEFVRHGENGFIIYDNPDSVGWGLGTLFTDFENARRMGANGRADAEARFDWRVISREVESVYHQ
jgi:glycosyltransferase involved in cell wall biosynthesis